MIWFPKIILSFQIWSAMYGQYFTYAFDSACVKNNDSYFINIGNKFEIGIQVTHNPLHQVMTRIFFLFLQNVLNYKNVRVIPVERTLNELDILENIRRSIRFPSTNMINLHVWTYNSHIVPNNVSSAGSSVRSGRYGWFVPISDDWKHKITLNSLTYEVFQNFNNSYYNNYVIDASIIQEILNISVDVFENPNCSEYKCVTILAEFKNDSSFIETQLNEMGIMANVLWIGFKFTETVQWLIKEYKSKYPDGSKRIIILHWIPSVIINDIKQFAQITMPKCEYFESLQKFGCKYEYTPIVKYYAKSLESDKRLMSALQHFYLRDEDVTSLWKDLTNKKNYMNYDAYNNVACNWLSNNTDYYNTWKVQPIKELLIGGIFPINVTNKGYGNIVKVAKQAETAINKEQSILPGYNLKIIVNNGQCKSDMAMKTFIHYSTMPNMLGILGPACSKTVEPIAGIAKHMNIIVMSYSADGAYLLNGDTYPYFFRTVGSNIVFGDAYINIMKAFEWNRVGVLTENESTEYVLSMERKFKYYNFSVVMTTKIQSVNNPSHLKDVLQQFKRARSKIIIADLNFQNAVKTLCEAHKLKMTQQEDYVWFLPHWLPKDFEIWQSVVNNSCTAQELQNAINGHFSLMHTPFGNLQALMQERITIAEWKDLYKRQHGEDPSYYAGFTYDAVWAYAYAAHKLLLEDNNAFNYLRIPEITKKLSDLIWKTKFNGISGNVFFARGELSGSRIINLDFLQWRNVSFIKVGKFKPFIKGNVTTGMYICEGKLLVNMTAIYWKRGKAPEDGKFECNFSTLARAFDVSCDIVIIIVAIVMCLFAMLCISFITFCFLKQRYKRKLKRSAQIMKMFGIDLLTPSLNKKNTLDKWELAKENVVINRRLGEGAFGMVYGGEAQLTPGEWTAVAVKTLKAGQATEDRLDFLSEAEAMKKFDHNNIIKLLGVCLQSEPIYTIMEFMLYGDLKTFLLARRNMIKDKINDESDISSKRLTRYAMDVAKGLAYLAEKKYVHRDIACRNCLVNVRRVVKIADFGMARPTFESDYYRYNRKGVRKLFPVRWMPPETLTLGIFTTASDIWSFGIVLYEVISCGSYPYQGLTNNQVLDYVKNGYTMQIPVGVRPELEGLFKVCWSQDAIKRPTAIEIVEYISNYPRLLNPSVEIPVTTMDMPDNKMAQTYECKDFNDSNSPINVIERMLHFNSNTHTPTALDGYSVMSPLLTK